LHNGVYLRLITKLTGKKRPQPEGLRRAQQAKKKAA
jgi:hypothetical protein